MTNINRTVDIMRNMSDLLDSKWFNFVGGNAIDTMKVVPVDIIERITEYEIRTVIPGAKKESINVSVEHDELRISVDANTAYDEDKSDDKYLYKGIRSEEFKRVIPNLSAYNIQTDEIKSVYKDGILSITMPRVKETQPKIIDVTIE